MSVYAAYSIIGLDYSVAIVVYFLLIRLLYYQMTIEVLLAIQIYKVSHLTVATHGVCVHYGYVQKPQVHLGAGTIVKQ